MFEELLTVSSDEEEEDIKIVGEKLKDSKHISTPSKVQKMKQIVDVLSKQGHVPLEAAAKVRNIQFFSSQGPLSLEEGGGGADHLQLRRSQRKKWAVRREISPHDREGRAGGALADLASSQEDLSPSDSRVWELLAFDTSEEKDEVEESSSSSRSPSPVAANIATAEGSTRPRDYKELLAVNSSD